MAIDRECQILDEEAVRQMILDNPPPGDVKIHGLFTQAQPELGDDFFVYESPAITHEAELEAQRADGPDHLTLFLIWLFACCTGGRPMRRLDGPPGFVESVTGAKKVHHWQDLLGRVWLAEDRWSWFRIPVESR